MDASAGWLSEETTFRPRACSIFVTLLSTLPEDASLEEIAREIELLAGIKTACEQVRRREGIPAEEARKLVSAVAEKLSALDAERYLNERAERGRKVDIDANLAKFPSVEPELRD
jgi:hypothetical protein